MKFFLTSLALITTFSALSALAEIEQSPIASRCDTILKLSDSQKLEIKEVSKAANEKLLSLAQEIKVAKNAADKVLAKIEASKEEATAAANLLTAKAAEVQTVKQAEKLAVLFDILTPEQRLKKVKCEQAPQRPYGQVHRRPVPPVHRHPIPYGPGRIEHRPTPNYRPGRVVISHPSRHPVPYYTGRRGGVVHPSI